MGDSMGEITEDDVNSKINFIMPAYVVHGSGNPDDPNGKWNEGFLKNEGGFISVTKDVAKFGTVDVYAGLIGGHVDNSQSNDSSLIGGVVGAEVPLGGKYSAHAEVVVGAVDGYATEINGYNKDSIEPAFMVGVGVKREFNTEVTGKFSVGVDAIVLPAETLGNVVRPGKENMADSLVFGIRMSKQF